MAKRTAPDPTALAAPARSPLEEAQAAFDAADLALTQARANLSTLRDRKARMDEAMKEAGAEVRAASAGLASAEPSAERVYDDAVRALATTQQRLEALREHAVPGAEAAVKRCEAERGERRQALQRLEMREAVRVEMLPADAAFYAALDAAEEALKAAVSARRAIQGRFPHDLQPPHVLDPAFLSWGAPRELYLLMHNESAGDPFKCSRHKAVTLIRQPFSIEVDGGAYVPPEYVSPGGNAGVPTPTRTQVRADRGATTMVHQGAER